MGRQRLSLLTCVMLVGLGLLFTSSINVRGQAAARPNRGMMPTGSYAVSDIENISLTNGNLNIGIALASLPPIAGGKVGFTVRATYNSKLWDAVRAEAQTDPSDPSTKYTVSNLVLSNNGGWRVGAAYTIAFESIAEDYSFLPPSGNDPEYNLITSNNWRKVVLTTPDGATHELRPVDYGPYNDGFFNHPYLRGYYKDTPHTVNGSMRYYSYDGSYVWAKIDNSQFCCFGTAQSWTLYLPDGTKVEQLITGEQRITDTNGNRVKIFTTANGNVFTTHYQDELTQREIRFVYDPIHNLRVGPEMSKTVCHSVKHATTKGIVGYVRYRQIGRTDRKLTKESPDMTETWNPIYDWSVEVWFRLQKDEDGYPRSKDWEQLVAWPVLESDRCFRIESIPFFVKGIARGDIIKVKVSENSDVQEGEFFEFESIVERGGHNTYRLLLREKQPTDPELTKEELLTKGLALEVEDDDFFAVDVPPSVNQKEIDDFLIAEAESGRWGLEDGFVRSTPR